MKYIFKGKVDISDILIVDIIIDEKVICFVDSFFNKRGENVFLVLENVKKLRRNLSLIIVGKVIIEQDVFEKIQVYNEKIENLLKDKGKGRGKGKENNKLVEYQKLGLLNI